MIVNAYRESAFDFTNPLLSRSHLAFNTSLLLYFVLSYIET